MAVLTSVVGHVSDLGSPGGREDPIFLTSEERASAHMATETASGRVVRISLPRGTELNDGDVVEVVGETLVVVRPANERLFIVRPEGALMWGVAGFHLGNLHRPVRFRDDAMLTPADPKVADVLREAGIEFEAVEAPFVGVRYGSYSGHDHHDHDHDHHHHHHDHGTGDAHHAHD